ncbi:MAG TPA: class I SAM-dependent methyltransferase, partial [Bacteroidia bacterium]|nr:class I SAM-dependent methyltransferase [Bacteroidia bacterium]
MEKHHTHCLVCGSPEYGVLDTEYAHAYLVKCTSCGFVFGSRIPSETELSNHYAQYPRDNSISPVTTRRYEELLEQFEPYRRTNRMLDIGCGDGHFLATAKSKGWEVFGTEFTDEAVSIGHAKGIEMRKGKIQDWTDRGDFDVITSFEVLEHINDGIEHVSTIKKLLRNGGLFYFTTPNFDALSRRVLGGKWKNIEYPEHLSYYTAKSMNRLLVSCGLKRLTLITTGLAFRKSVAADSKPSSHAGSEENLRVAVEKNKVLQLVKSLVNR